MSKLYYGDGRCSIEGNGIRFIVIRYRGAILIDDKTPDNFFITAQSDGIAIVPFRPNAIELKELFVYTGEFRIISARTGGNTDDQGVTIHRVMDYSELLTGNSEDMTTISEDLQATYIHDSRVIKTELMQPYIKNLHTKDTGSVYYLENGDSYVGYYHIKIIDNTLMTESDRTEVSQLLYFKLKDGRLISTYNPNHLPHNILTPARPIHLNSLAISSSAKGKTY